MRILHLLSQTHLTGAEAYAVDLVEEQVRAGHLVWQISNQFHLATQAAKIQFPVECQTKKEFLSSLFRLRSFLVENEIQVVHCHSRAAAKLCSLARLGLKSSTGERVAQVSTVHGRQHVSVSKKLFNQYGEMTVAVCENIQKQLVGEFGYKENRIKVIGNAVSESRFSSIEKMNSEAHSPRQLKIAIIGRCTGPKKTRTEKFIEALAGLKIDQTVKVTIIGDRAKSVSLPAGVEVEIIEHIELNARIYQSYDVVVGSGRVAIESMIAGTPCLAFGEDSFLGLITSENFKDYSGSNFGDIGLDFSGPHLDSAKFEMALVEIQKNFQKPEDFLAEREELKHLCQQYYSKVSIASKIQRIYESAYFLRHHSQWIPILMYHKIPSEEMDSEHKIFVSKSNFERHLKCFKWMGLKTTTFSELRKFRKGLLPWTSFPSRPLLLTFDDGYQNNLDHADPLLKQYDFRAQIYLLANSELPSNTWDQPDSSKGDALVSGAVRKKWVTSQFEVGSHGIDHVHLPQLSNEQARKQIFESKKMLESELGVPMICYAFTYGDTNEELAQMAEVAGYDYAVNTDSGGMNIEENPWAIFRVNIFPNENVWSLFKKTRTWYRSYYFRKRGK